MELAGAGVAGGHAIGIVPHLRIGIHHEEAPFYEEPLAVGLHFRSRRWPLGRSGERLPEAQCRLDQRGREGGFDLANSSAAIAPSRLFAEGASFNPSAIHPEASCQLSALVGGREANSARASRHWAISAMADPRVDPMLKVLIAGNINL